MTFDWYKSSDAAAAERVPVIPLNSPLQGFEDRLVVVTLHDGAFVPPRIARSPRLAGALEDGSLFEQYAQMRDWGANLVAGRLAAHLGLESWHRVNVARVVMDFNRFPGSSPAHADPLERLAIGGLVAERLNHTEKRYILEEWYDAVSAALEAAIRRALIVIVVHTYDTQNATQTARPAVSLLSRSHSYQRDSRLPYLTFDPLLPDILVESSVTRILRDRIGLTLEKSGIHVEHNYPYCLPDGSMEIRCQPWFYFQYVRGFFERDFPETARDPHYERVWAMLLNTNLRNAESRALSGYLHRYVSASVREGAPGFERPRVAYEHIAEFLDQHPALPDAYRWSPDRTSALCVEVRKDLLADFDPRGVPTGPPHEACADTIAAAIARGMRQYLEHDRPELKATFAT